MNHLRIPGYNFSATYGVQYINDPFYYKNFTFLQFQRATTDKHLNLVKHFKENIRKQTKTPVLYEIDDLLFGIPEWNYASDYYSKFVPSIEQILREVDGIVVSTDFLKQQYSKYNEKIEVIPNHLPKFLWGESIPQHTLDKPGKVKIVWAGSDNHFANKSLISKGIKGGDFSDTLINFIRKTTDDYHWIILGGCPAELNDLKNNGIEYHGWRSIFEFPRFYQSLQPDIVIAPLEGNDFNKAKSNLKLIEAVAIGAAGVYSDIDPYHGTHMSAKNPQDMVDMIEEVAGNRELRGKIYDHDLQLVTDVLYWESNDNVRRYIETYLKFFKRCLE